MIKKTLLLGAVLRLTAAAVLAAAPAAPAFAEYPDAPITVVVPYPPAGAADFSARIISRALQIGMPDASVIVQNMPGAGGNIGVAHVAHSKPDGYTLAASTIGTQAINQFLYKNMNFDPAKDLVPVAMIMTTPNVLSVSAKSPWHTLQDVIKAAKTAKHPISYASPGIGSSVHLTGAYFESMAGLHLLHVPFKGASASLPAVAGGDVDLLFDNLPGSIAQIKDGSLIRGIAVTSLERDPQLPDLPTFAESGLPGFDVTAWFALYAPKGTPQSIVDKLIAACRKGLQDPEIIASLKTMAAKPGTLFGPDLGAFEQKERERWGKLVRDQHIVIE